MGAQEASLLLPPWWSWTKWFPPPSLSPDSADFLIWWLTETFPSLSPMVSGAHGVALSSPLAPGPGTSSQSFQNSFFQKPRASSSPTRERPGPVFLVLTSPLMLIRPRSLPFSGDSGGISRSFHSILPNSHFLGATDKRSSAKW